MEILGLIAGWLAALLTLSAYSMRTMLPLRIAAIGANLSFITFSAIEWIPQTLVLHLILLPFNSYRLWEILDQTRRMRQVRTSDIDPLEYLGPLLRPVSYSAGTRIFQKGDAPDRLYYLKSGTVLLDEIDHHLSDGDLFGEIAFFTDARERTTSATCETDCVIMSVNEEDFMRIFYQNPAFGLFMIKLAAGRLLSNLPQHEQALHIGALPLDRTDTAP